MSRREPQSEGTSNVEPRKREESRSTSQESNAEGQPVAKTEDTEAAFSHARDSNRAQRRAAFQGEQWKSRKARLLALRPNVPSKDFERAQQKTAKTAQATRGSATNSEKPYSVFTIRKQKSAVPSTAVTSRQLLASMPILSSEHHPFATQKIGSIIVRKRTRQEIHVDCALRDSHITRLKAKFGNEFQWFLKHHRVIVKVENRKKQVPVQGGNGDFEEASLVTVRGDGLGDVLHVLNVIHQKIIEAPSEKEVQSAQVKPSSRLQPGEYAVRDRSEDEIVLEYALPSASLEAASERYGENLYLMARWFKVVLGIRAGNHPSPPDDAGAPSDDVSQRTYSVMISGSHAATKKIIGALGRYVNDGDAAPIQSDGADLLHRLVATEKEQKHWNMRDDRRKGVLHLCRNRLTKMPDQFPPGLEVQTGEKFSPVYLRGPPHVLQMALERLQEAVDKVDAAFVLSLRPIHQSALRQSSAESSLDEAPESVESPKHDADLEHRPSGTPELSTNSSREKASLSDESNESNTPTGHGAETQHRQGADAPNLVTNGQQKSASSSSKGNEPKIRTYHDPVHEGPVYSHKYLVRVDDDASRSVLRGVLGGDGSRLKAMVNEADCHHCYVRTEDRFEVQGSLQCLERFYKAFHARMRQACRLAGISMPTIAAGRLEGPLELLEPEKKTPSLRREAREAASVSDEIKTTFRLLTHPVVVITSQTARSEGEDKRVGARAVTVSSFNTVSLQPQPVISFNLKRPSRTWDAICASSELRVHILDASSRGAALAHVFTQPLEKPEDGFRRLGRIRASVFYFDDLTPPQISLQGTVLAQIRAHILPEKCQVVGDHVVVVARAVECTADTRVSQDETAVSALAYSNRNYRGHAEAIQPTQIQQAKQEKQTTDPKSQKPTQTQQATREQAPAKEPTELPPAEDPKPSTSQSSAGRDMVEQSQAAESKPPEPEDEGDYFRNDPVLRALREARDAKEAGQDVGRPGLMDLDDDFVHEQNARAATANLPSTSSTRSRRPNGGTRDLSRRGSGSPRSKATRGFSTVPKGTRSYSMLNRAKLTEVSHRKYFSTMARSLKNGRSSSKAGDDFRQWVEPSALKMNVADYLGQPETDEDFVTARPRKATRSLWRKKQESDRAEYRLSTHNGKMDEQTQADLEQLVKDNASFIDQGLAWNAAQDLRIMLDKGRVDFRRARFMESAIERGQASLLETAKSIRQKAQSGQMKQEEFMKKKEFLENTHAVLLTETNRLRQFVDEEGENAFDDVEEESEQSNSFDGFKGNR